MAMAASLRDFLLAALQEDQRLDGRRPFDSRRLTIKFAREDGAAEVQLGQTHIMSVVSGQLVQPYPDRPNEGSLVVYTEFSPMADPSFEAGRPGESAVELGRVIDRGLRESRAIDTESLCVLAGKAVWSLRIDICILDNGGNLIDAANVAALAALLSFRRPECSLGGADGQEVIIHPPETREPHPLIIHYLPIAVTFAFFGDGEFVVVDPSYKEELVMRGRFTVTMNIHGDICAIQKGGGVGVSASEIMRCLRIASSKVADITALLKKAAETHEVERAQRRIKRHRNISASEYVKVVKSEDVKKDFEMKDVMSASAKVFEKNVISKVNASGLGMLDDDNSSSDDSSDASENSDTEEKEVLVSADTDGHSKEQIDKTIVSGKLQGSLFQGGASQWLENTKPLSSTSTGLSTANAFGESEQAAGHTNQASVMGQTQGSQVTFEASSIFVKMESVSFNSKHEGQISNDEPMGQRDGTLANIKGGTSQPLSLLDAVKKKNLKKKRGGASKS